MIWLLIASGGFYLFAVLWVLYLAIMNLKRHEDRLTTPSKVIGYPVLAVGYVLDALFNWSVGTIMFLQIPKTLLFTGRLERNIQTQKGGWRFDLALYLCENLLDPFDPDGLHCRRK